MITNDDDVAALLQQVDSTMARNDDDITDDDISTGKGEAPAQVPSVKKTPYYGDDFESSDSEDITEEIEEDEDIFKDSGSPRVSFEGVR